MDLGSNRSGTTTPEGAEDALGGLAVVDLTSSVAGQFCGRLFADHGAHVVLLEPEAGSPLRAESPVVTGSDGAARSALFWHLNLGKESVAEGASGVPELIAEADVILVDGARPLPALTARNQVVVRITPFGDVPGYASWTGGEIVFQALSGTMHENGLPGREPLYGVGHRASYAAGAAAFTTGLATLLAGAAGRHDVDVSIAEIAMSMNFNRVAHYSYNGSILGRDAKETQRAVVKVKDGYLGVFANVGRWVATCRSLGVEELITDPRFIDHEHRRENWPQFRVELEARLAERGVDELVDSGQRARAVIARSMPLAALRTSEQLLVRGFWEGADVGPLPQLGPIFGYSATPQRTGRVAPDVVAPEIGDIRPHTPRWWATLSADPTAPLAGVKVLDLSSAWAGPMAARMLAALGAQVLKVEGPGRIDDWRGAATGADSDRYPDFEPGERPFDRHFQFNTQNQGKRGITLDLKSEAGKRLALRLAARSDIVLANFATGALERMGLGWESLRGANHRTILIEMPAYGSTGPMANWLAYGPSMELMSGMAGIIGYGDGRPVVTGPAYNDPIGGFHGAAAAVAALAAREVTGCGQRVEIAQRDASMHWIGAEIIAAIVTGGQPVPVGNELDDVVPHRAYRTAGEDEWLAVACYDDAQFARLWAVVGSGCDAAMPLAERRAARETIDAAITAWAAGRNKHAAARELQDAGVPAAPVMNARDLHDSDYLASRGLIQTIRHREAQVHRYPILPVHIDGATPVVDRPAPCFGEHNRDVLVGELGLTEAEYQELVAADVVADIPRGARALAAG